MISRSEESSRVPDRGAGHRLNVSANALLRVFAPLSSLLSMISAVLVFVMAILILTDILLRIVFNSPLRGILEFEQLMLATVVFLALPYATLKKRHVSIDLISVHYPPKLRALMDSIFNLLGAYLFLVFCWQNVIRGIEFAKNAEVGSATGIPLSPFLFVTAFGSALISIILIAAFLESQAELLTAGGKPWLTAALTWVFAVLVMVLPFLTGHLLMKAPPLTAGLIGWAFLFVLMLSGMPIAFALGLMGFLGLWYMNGLETSLQVARMSVFDSVASFFYVVIPFFVLMGFLCFSSGLSRALYDVGHKLFGRLPGGLAIGTIAGCAGFASICGDSMATAVTMGSVAIPEMKKHKYDDSLATSSVAAGGTLGILIPPSIGFIIYGLITDQSIGKLFLAGIIPGIILASVFSATILVRCRRRPALGPPGPRVPFSEKLTAVRGVWPILVLFLVVMGGIYLGIFTATEGGAVGTIVALVIGIAKRTLSRRGLYDACTETMGLTSMIFAIIIGVTILGYFITVSEIPMKLADIIVSLHVSRYLIFVGILVLYLFLGMVMNIIPMIMITLPTIFPTVVALGFDPIWFGVIMVIMMEMGQITPPVGINVFVIAGVAKDVPMGTIFRGIWPFVIGEIIVIILLTLLPDLALMLPNSMKTLAALGK